MTAHYRDLTDRGEQAEPVLSALAAPAQIAGRTGAGSYRSRFKRLFDVSFVTMALPAVLPVILLLALIVALDGGRPFFRQTRVGRGGRSFSMWKLRSMVGDADRQLQAHLASSPAARAEWDKPRS